MGSAAQPPLTITVSSAGGLRSWGAAPGPPRTASRPGLAYQGRLRWAVGDQLPAAVRGADAGRCARSRRADIQFAFGIPTADMLRRIRTAGARFSVQVGSAENARRAVDAGAAYLICQGIEAAGHVQSTTPLDDLLPAVVEQAKDVPVSPPAASPQALTCAACSRRAPPAC